MENLDIKETIQEIKKTILEIKKELEKSITNGKRNENTDMQEKVNNCWGKAAVKVVHEFEETIKNKKKQYMVSLSSRSNVSKV